MLRGLVGFSIVDNYFFKIVKTFANKLGLVFSCHTNAKIAVKA